MNCLRIDFISFIFKLAPPINAPLTLFKDNIDSYKRYIYIHGTSEEGRLGIPSSHGCIRMKNKEVIHLYNQIEVGTLVLIL